MSEIYGDQHKHFQEQLDTNKLADRQKEMIVLSEITEQHQAFIESHDIFFKFNRS